MLLLLLLLVPTAHGAATWHFSGNLSCPMDAFTYRIQVWEDDWFTDDLLTSQDEIISYFPHSYKIDAQDTDDGFDLGGMFEIYLAIYHNCNPQGNWKVVWHDCGNYPINVGDVTQTQNVELYNQGEIVLQLPK
ncbi:hypothetical protein CRE_25926 [Caenorhabditis remanei]|uniref:Uncharacterized protein n=1 Tax=Caenorhabditis remanei TaxID=31234 RepID=E3NJA9_CAERE|nr:hypothetical protein CRE_25926 [Caenorhabditis remanei]